MKTDVGRTIKFPESRSIEVEAAAWVARIDRGLTAEESATLATWQGQSSRHREALAKLSTLWSGLDVLPIFGPTLALNPQTRLSHLLHVFWNSRQRAIASIAAVACAAGVVLALSWIYLPNIDGRRAITNGRLAGSGLVARASPNGEPASTLARSVSYQTKVGEQRLVSLPDGSSVLVNTNSWIEVNFTSAQRSVRLLRGEAYFDVVHDPGKPFRVAVGNRIIHDLGTAFDVRFLSRQVEVIVTKGKVALAMLRRGGSIAGGPRGSRGERSLGALTAGHSAVLGEKAETVALVSDAAISRMLSWRFGILVYAGQPLSQVVADVSRYTEVKIEIADAKLAALPVGGYFQVGQTGALFEALQKNFGIRVERIDPTHVRLLLPS